MQQGDKATADPICAGNGHTLSRRLDLRPPEVSSTQCFFDSVTECELSGH